MLISAILANNYKMLPPTIHIAGLQAALRKEQRNSYLEIYIYFSFFNRIIVADRFLANMSLRFREKRLYLLSHGTQLPPNPPVWRGLDGEVYD